MPRKSKTGGPEVGSQVTKTRNPLYDLSFEDVRRQTDICQVYTIASGGLSANAAERRNGFRRLRCPARNHNDSTFSFDINQRGGYCKCFGCDLKGDVFKLLIGIGVARTPAEALRWIVDHNLIAVRYDPTGQERVVSSGGGGRSFRKLLEERRTAVFSYLDADEKLRYQVIRLDGLDPDTKKPSKRFTIRRPAVPGEILVRWKRTEDGAVVYEGNEPVREEYVARKGDWRNNADDVERIPYRLPELLAACRDGRTVFVPEGEGKVEALRAIGLAATTNAGGANWAWPLSWTKYFEGTQGVVLLADCDAPGRHAARERARVLQKANIRSAVLDLRPEFVGKYDIRDWLDERKGRAPEQIVDELRDLFLRALLQEPPRLDVTSGTAVA